MIYHHAPAPSQNFAYPLRTLRLTFQSSLFYRKARKEGAKKTQCVYHLDKSINQVFQVFLSSTHCFWFAVSNGIGPEILE